MYKNILINQRQAVGDNVIVTTLIHDIKTNWPDTNIYVNNKSVTYPVIFEGNPDVIIDTEPSTAKVLVCRYRTEQSFSGIHFAHAMHESVSKLLQTVIPRGPARPYLYPKPLREELKFLLEKPYMVIDAGYKTDFTAKHWGHANYQEVVNTCPQYVWVQIGSDKDKHRPLEGAVNLIGKTSLLDLISLIECSHGVLTPVSCPAHIAGALGRQCITIAGGREQASWESYPGHYYFCTYNDTEPACWRSQLSGECRNRCTIGQETVAGCMKSITPDMLKEVLHGDDWQLGGQIDYREHSAVASGRHQAYIEVRCGSSRCGAKNSGSEQATQLADRRARRVVRPVGPSGPLPNPAKNEAVLGRQAMKPTPSWRRNLKGYTKLSSVIPHPIGGSVYYMFNGTFPTGEFLGDTIQCIIAADLMYRSEMPDKVYLSLTKDFQLNFLWDHFIKTTKAEVMYEDQELVATRDKKSYLFYTRQAAKEVNGFKFDRAKFINQTHKEIFASVMKDGRFANMNTAERMVKCQPEVCAVLPAWECSSRPFGYKQLKRDDYLFVSPLEKAHGNRIMTLPFWQMVIKKLDNAGYKVKVNDNTGLVENTNNIEVIYPNFKDLVDVVRHAKLCLTGNTGTMWLAGATDSPVIACEGKAHDPNFSATDGRIRSLKYVVPVPDADLVLAVVDRFGGK